MSSEQLMRYVGGISLIVIPVFGYGITHWRLGRKRPQVPGSVPYPPDFSSIPGLPRAAQRFFTKCALIFKWWMLIPSIVCGIVLLIDAIMHTG